MGLDLDLRATLAGFVGALVVLGVLFAFIGVGEILDALEEADTHVLLAVLAVAVGWLSAWGLSLRTVLDVLGSFVPVRLAVPLFAAAIFANNVTPFGQAGGEPFSALLIARATETEYETSLAAIASVDSLNFIPSVSLALLGIGYFSAEVAFGRRMQVAALAVGSLAVVVPAIGYLGWRNRYRIEVIVIRALTPMIRSVWRVLPGRSPPSTRTVRRRIEGFFHAIERVAADRQGLALALGFSTLGWLCMASSLWLSLLALGHIVPFAAILFVVPVGAIAGITPLPGGLGGVEFVLVFLLAPTTGVTHGTAAAAVIIHRTATYWLPTVVGGGTAAMLGATSRPGDKL